MNRLDNTLAAMPGCVVILLLALGVIGLMGFIGWVEAGGPLPAFLTAKVWPW